MQSSAAPVITTENLTRKFGARRAVDSVSISVSSGESLVLFGPNGAGKTTLLRMLGGILKPSSGGAKIGDVSMPGGADVRRRIGIVSHHSLLYDALTARENVEFAARLYGVRQYRQNAMQALEAMQIDDRADTRVSELSRGMKQRVSVARAIVHNPDVLLADEPFTGLDVVGAKALSTLLIESRSRGAALVIVTHNVDEGLSLATRAAIMNRGSMVSIEDRTAIEPHSFGSRYAAMVSADA
ncbi:MAG TPA: heme ABC exporter ATP-binding protein CcmA [Gemmatimonadaceae bacterium]